MADSKPCQHTGSGGPRKILSNVEVEARPFTHGHGYYDCSTILTLILDLRIEIWSISLTIAGLFVKVWGDKVMGCLGNRTASVNRLQKHK